MLWLRVPGITRDLWFRVPGIIDNYGSGFPGLLGIMAQGSWDYWELWFMVPGIIGCYGSGSRDYWELWLRVPGIIGIMAQCTWDFLSLLTKGLSGRVVHKIQRLRDSYAPENLERKAQKQMH